MMKQRLPAAASVLVVLLSILALSTPVQAATSTTVAVGNIVLGSGAGGQVAITVKNITATYGLGACWFTIIYNPAVIRLDDVLAGDAPFGTPTYNPTGGSVTLIAAQGTQVPGPKGDIVVARLKVTALALGSTALTLTIKPGGLIDTHGNNIPAGVVNGQVSVVAGAAAKLAFTTQPSSSNAAGAAFGTQPVVTIQDAAGNKVTTSTDAVTLAITAGTGAALLGTPTVNAVKGVATFKGLSVNLAGSNYTLSATSGNLTPATSSAFTVMAGAAAKLAFSTQPSSSTAGAVFGTQPVVTIQDAAGNKVTASTAAVTLAITLGTGNSGAALSGTKTVNAVNGMATFSGLSVNLVGSGYTLSATSGALTSATSSAFDVTVRPAAKLAFATQPSSSNAAGAYLGTQPVVTIQDAAGSTVTASTAAVTLAITPGTGASGAALSGNTTVNAVNGAATFRDLSVDLAGSNYTLSATSGALTSATSSAFDVTVRPAAKLAFTTQPGSSNTAGADFDTQPVVTIQDADGNKVTTSTAAVTLAITPGTGTSGADLSGNTTVNAVNGVATFSGLSVNLAGSGYTLGATSGTLTPATSTAFDVVAGSAAKLAFTTQPGSSNTVGAALGTQPVVAIRDAGGNTVTTSTDAVTLAITPGTGASGADLSGTKTVNAVNGVATFSGLSVNLVGSGYTLSATSGALTSATSSAFDVVGRPMNVWIIIVPILFVDICVLVYFFVIRPAMQRRKA